MIIIVSCFGKPVEVELHESVAEEYRAMDEEQREKFETNFSIYLETLDVPVSRVYMSERLQ